MYANILLFIAAISLFSTHGREGTPSLSFIPTLAVTAAIFYGWLRVVRFLVGRIPPTATPGRLETLLSWAALGVFELLILVCSPGWYFDLLPLAHTFAVIPNALGLGLFFALLLVLHGEFWRREATQAAQPFSWRKVVRADLSISLPVVLPWLLITFCHDLVLLLPAGAVRDFLAGTGSIPLAAVVLLFVLPGLVRRSMGCRPLPPGAVRDHLEAFCRRLHFSGELHLWPLHEGRAITAAVVGILPGFRHLLLTPALLEQLSPREIEAVIAHEIGHVKRCHLLLYFLLSIGFVLVAEGLGAPLTGLLEAAGASSLLMWSGLRAQTAAELLAILPVLVLVVLLFRFVFAWFMRNFERQADLYSMQVIGSAKPLIATFELIGRVTGTRDDKSWHHYGLGERIAFLERADREPQLLHSHNRRLYALLVAALLTMGTFSGVRLFAGDDGRQTATAALHLTPEDRALLERHRLSAAQASSVYRRLGDLLVGRLREREGLLSYERSLALNPENVEAINNLAWLLITSRDLALRDPERALPLALQAASASPGGSVYDTLAEVYWANGMTDLALDAEAKAERLDPGHSLYYRSQSTKFSVQTYEEAVSRMTKMADEIEKKGDEQQRPESREADGR